MSYIVVGVLKETKPMAYYALAAFLFVLSQLAWFMLGKVICEVRPVILLLKSLTRIYLTSGHKPKS